MLNTMEIKKNGEGLWYHWELVICGIISDWVSKSILSIVYGRVSDNGLFGKMYTTRCLPQGEKPQENQTDSVLT